MDFLNTTGSCETKLHRYVMKQKEETTGGEHLKFHETTKLAYNVV